MVRKYLAFDIETAKDVPGADFNWKPHRPLGIACAATLACGAAAPTVWFSEASPDASTGQMSRERCRELVDYLTKMVSDGYTIVTWNGLGFDFDVLSEESGAFDLCRDLATNHVDLMFHVFCDRGFPVALDKAAEALKIKGKPKDVTGKEVPQLWAKGERDKVLAYVGQDVNITLQIAQMSEANSKFVWKTRSGTASIIRLTRGWLIVREAMKLPQPDTSWMTNAIPRNDFTDWLNSGPKKTNH